MIAITLSLISALAKDTFASKLVNLTPVPFTQVTISDKFWTPRRETNRTVSLPHSLDMLEKAGNVKDFELAAAGAHTGYQGPVFMDSDLYKTLEAVSYSLATNPDEVLSKRIDGIIAKMAAAQMPDGYLNTYYQVNEPTRRFTNLRDNHELYCAGHMFEAAVAHYQATGKKNLLNIAMKYADLLVNTFGDKPGHRMGYPGHPEIELALVKMANVTKKQSYFDLARFFISNRGTHFFAKEHKTPEDRYDGTYWIDDVPIREHANMKGHAVRATYLMSGTTDVAARDKDEALLQMLNRVWRNTAEKNMYITGGIGPSGSNEGFTTDYDLPNLTAYQETCASVALAQWNYRMGLAYGDAKYADLVERSLYNGVLSGVSCDGTKFFYVNPLESRGGHHRSEWFGCACCPPNVARTLASLGGYAYATSADALYVNLYIAGGVDVKIGAKPLHLDVTTNYPWDGKVLLRPKVDSVTEAGINLRVPAWCRKPSLTINGAKSELLVKDGYARVSGKWSTGDRIELNLPMEVQRIAANPGVKDDQFKTALQRGPLVYCLESTDQHADLSQVAVPIEAEFTARSEPALLGGMIVLDGEGYVADDANWNRNLYQPAPTPKKVSLRAIPYCFWDNREAGPMDVWMPTALQPKPVRGIESQAKVSISYKSGNAQPWAINDGKEPKSSGDHPGDLCHWWPHHGGTEWVQYNWKSPISVSGSKVYWFDDSSHGGCKLPGGWTIQYLDGTTWKDVKNKGEYPVALDRWCNVSFEPVTTTALRLNLTMQKDWAAGIHEWKIIEVDD